MVCDEVLASLLRPCDVVTICKRQGEPAVSCVQPVQDICAGGPGSKGAQQVLSRRISPAGSHVHSVRSKLGRLQLQVCLKLILF